MMTATEVGRAPGGGARGTWASYGLAAAQALRDEIARAKGAEPLAPVTVVVPSNQVGVSARRQLARGDLGPVCGAGAGLIGVTFVTPYRLAELLGAAPLATQGRRPVSTPVLAAAVRSVLASEPGSFGPVAGHAATESALVDAYRELRDLDDAALALLAASSVRAREVVRVFRGARTALEADWYDEDDLMASAAAAVAAGTAPAEVGTVVVYLPQRLSRHAGALLGSLARANGLVVIAGTTGDAKADAEVAQSVRRLDAGLADHMGAPPDEPVLATATGPTTTSITTASDADDEVRAAVRTVVDAVRAGTRMDRIAILYAAHEPYGRLLAHQLAAAEVKVNGTATLAVAGRVAGRALLGLLALPAGGWRRQDVFAWLGGSPILVDGHRAPTTTWEAISRDAGVVGGRGDWDRRLARYAAERRDLASEAEASLDGPDDPRAWLVERHRTNAARAEALRSFVIDLADRLASAADHPARWGERSAWAKALLAELLGGPRQRTAWPDPEQRATERLELALDRLAVLDGVEGQVPLDVFARSLQVELEADLGRIGRFGEGVLVGPVSMGVGVDLDLVIVVGMAEGTFPSIARDDSLLPDEDRDAAAGALPLRSGHVDRLHHQFTAVVAGAKRQVLTVPKGDLRRSRERVPSRWVLDVASALAGETWWSEDLLTRQAPWLTHLASFDAALRSAEPATDQEHRLRQLLARAPKRSELPAAALHVDPDGPLAPGAEVVDARWSTALTRFDGNLAGLDVPSPTERGASASQLEAWASCPHAYFLGYVLGVEPVEQPEDALQITALDRGSLVHEALEEFIVEAIAQGRVPAPGSRWSEDDHRRLQEIAEARCEAAEARGLTGRTLFWQRDRLKILLELDLFLHADDAHRAATGAVPIAAELPFGRQGRPPVEYPLPDGRTIPLRGLADRVDRAPDGTLHVLDYKTGKADSYKGLSGDDPHQGAKHLQLAVYGLAARQDQGTPDAPIRADYWFTSRRGGYVKLGYEVTDEVIASVSRAIGAIVEGIEHGMFSPRPAEPSTSPWPECPYCDPDGLGTTELRRQWLGKLDDPALEGYLLLIAPPGPDADATSSEVAP